MIRMANGRRLTAAKVIAEMSETVEEDVRHVSITCPVGTVTVLASDGAVTTIEAELEHEPDDPLPTVSWTVEAGTLAIEVHNPESTGRGNVRLTVSAPRAASVTATSQVARLEVHERDAAVELTTSAGSIRASDVHAEVTLRSKAGAIEACDVRAESILLETHAGSIVAERIDVQFAKVASQVGRVNASFITRPRVVEAITTVGKLLLAVPAGSYSGRRTGRIKIDDGIEISRSADSELDVSVTLGGARITTSDT
jgi:hypothetical protein